MSAEPEPAGGYVALTKAYPEQTETVTYIFGITRSASDLPDGLPQLPGGGPVETVDAGGLRALVCRLGQRTLEILQAPAPDGLGTLAAVARGHDVTLTAVARIETVLPLRLGSVVSDEREVRQLLQRHTSAFVADLDRLDGYAEWVVMVHLAQQASAGDPPNFGKASGRDYLQRRLADQRGKQRRREARRQLAARIHERLAACADSATVVTDTANDERPPLLHGVYLTDRHQRECLGAAVNELRAVHEGTEFELTGPWPPYHFMSNGIGTTAEDSDEPGQ